MQTNLSGRECADVETADHLPRWRHKVSIFITQKRKSSLRPEERREVRWEKSDTILGPGLSDCQQKLKENTISYRTEPYGVFDRYSSWEMKTHSVLMIFFYYLLFCVYWGQKQNPHKKKKISSVLKTMLMCL